MNEMTPEQANEIVTLRQRVSELQAELEALQKHYDSDAAVYKAELEQARKQLWQAQVTIKRLDAELAQAAERQREKDAEVARNVLVCACSFTGYGPHKRHCPVNHRDKIAAAILAQAEVKK